MITPMHLTQVLSIDMRVDLCCRDIDVSEHLLDSAKVGASLEQVRRKRVPQRMRRHVFRDRRTLDMTPQDLPGAHARQWLAARIEEEHALPLPFLELRSQLAKVDCRR